MSLNGKKDAVDKMLEHRQNSLCISIDLCNDSRFSMERFDPLNRYLAEWGRREENHHIPQGEILTVIFTSSMTVGWFDAGIIGSCGGFEIHALFVRSLMLDRFSISLCAFNSTSDIGKGACRDLKSLCETLNIQNIIACDFYNFQRDIFCDSVKKISECGLTVSVAVFKGLNKHAITDVDNEGVAAESECKMYQDEGWDSKVLYKEMRINDFLALQSSMKYHLRNCCEIIKHYVEGVTSCFNRKYGNETFWKLVSRELCFEKINTANTISRELILNTIYETIKICETIKCKSECLDRIIPDWKDWLECQFSESNYSFPLQHKDFSNLWEKVTVDSFPEYIGNRCQQILEQLDTIR